MKRKREISVEEKKATNSRKLPLMPPPIAMGGNDNDTVFSPANALLMPCIVEMILPYLPLMDLRNCKAVCRLWNDEVNRFMKKVKSFKITQNKFEDAFASLTPGKGQPVSYLSQLLCRECSTSDPGFEKLVIFKGRFLHKLVLDKCQLNINSFRNLILIDSFPHLSILVLKQVIYEDTLAPAPVRHTIFLTEQENDDNRPKLDSLKSLEIDERGPTSQSTLKNIAVMCPNLQRLSYSNCPVPSLLEFKHNRIPITLSKLEFLQLAPIDGRKMDHSYFEVLMKLRLTSLKTLFLYGMNPGGKIRMSCLQKFLKSVAPTLISLHLGQRIMYNPEYQPKVPSPFPVSLPNLKRMSVGPGFIHSLKFLEKMPSLTSFTCPRVCSEDWVKVTQKGLPTAHNLLSSMDLGDITYISLGIIGPRFPNLTRLELNVCRVQDHDEIMRAICAHFPKLQMFNIYDVTNQNRLTDSGLTGFSTKDCNKLSKSQKKTFQPKRSNPYIGDLKCLIDLRLQYLSGKLTDVSVLHGIKDLPALFALDISKSQITKKSLEVLANTATNLSVLYIRDCGRITAEDITAFRVARPHVQLRT